MKHPRHFSAASDLGSDCLRAARLVGAALLAGIAINGIRLAMVAGDFWGTACNP